MIEENDNGVEPLQRVPSGVAGLDEILQGGFLRGGVYIVQGAPGAGKTILANEICFRHVATGGRAAYITLLAESHTRMLQHLRPLAFFDESVIADGLYYVSAFRTLEDEGLKGLLNVLRREIKGQRASLLVLDGVVAVEESAQSDREFKKFIHELQAHAVANDCTVLLLTTVGPRTVSAEHTIVDGLIELRDESFAIRTQRYLQVQKFRGSGFLRGQHPFRITEAGIRLFPRIEAVFASPSRRDEPPQNKVSSGVPGFDVMLEGGLVAASITGLIGPSGVGKTTAGLHFLSASSPADPGLFFGFFETPERLHQRARILELPLADAVERGVVEIMWQPQGENILDELAHRMLDAMRRRNVTRLFIDGLGGLMESTTHPERVTRFFSCLANELRARQVTTLFTMETRDLVGSSIRMPISGLSSMVENLVLMRFVEYRSSIHRVLSIAKLRNSGYDKTIREFRVTRGGIRIGEPLYGTEGVVTGVAREPRAVPAEPSGGRDAGEQ